MCGRYAITLPKEAMTGLFDLDVEPPDLVPRWNVAPTQPIPVVGLDAEGRRALRLFRWGLHPAWMKEPPGAKSMINARAEGVADKPFFRSAFKARRALAPADGFYEWKATPAGKVPHFIRRVGAAPLVFAALWERWVSAEGEEIRTAAILTCAGNADMAGLHERMPVILEQDAWGPWLDPKTPREALEWMLAPAPAGTLEAWPVSRAVNAPRNEGPELIAPAA